MRPIRKVLYSHRASRTADSDWIAAAAIGSAARHTSAGNGCHAANSSISMRLVHKQISAARDQGRDMAGRYALEARPRHAAMLDGEQAQQLQVDAKRDERRPDRAGVDALGNDKVADEADRIEECRKKDRVNRHAIARPRMPARRLAHGPPEWRDRWSTAMVMVVLLEKILSGRIARARASLYRNRPMSGFSAPPTAASM